MMLVPTFSRQAGILHDDGLDLVVRCAKDLGKVCGFAKDVGVANIVEIDEQMLFDFAYILSVYLNGSRHPSSENIKRLDSGRSPSEVGSISDRYDRVSSWIIGKYG